MKRAKICAVVTDRDMESVRKVERSVDLFEVRIDLIGNGWQNIALQIHKPWIATNRSTSNGGKWQGSERSRFSELLKAVELGADMVDVELGADGLEDVLPQTKDKAKCIISYHDWEGTPPLGKLIKIVKQEMAMGAYACKVITTARALDDNITVLRLIRRFPRIRVISFAMGTDGMLSRIASPLAGGYFTYASILESRESAPGQITAHAMRKIYRLIA